MSDDVDESFAAAMERLRAAVGPEALAEGERRGIGRQMLDQAQERIAEAELLDLIGGSVSLFSETPEDGWDE